MVVSPESHSRQQRQESKIELSTVRPKILWHPVTKQSVAVEDADHTFYGEGLLPSREFSGLKKRHPLVLPHQRRQEKSCAEDGDKQCRPESDQ